MSSITNCYQIPEDINKRLEKIESDGILYFIRCEALEDLRDDFVRYICKNCSNIDSIYHAFIQFKHIVSLHPLSVMYFIPANAGIETFSCMLRILLMFVKAGEEIYLDQTNLYSLFMLCRHEGWEILFNDITELCYQYDEHLASNILADAIRSAVEIMKKNHVPKKQIHRFVDRVVACPRLNAVSLMEYFKKRSTARDIIDGEPRNIEILISLMVEYGHFNDVLPYLDALSTYSPLLKVVYDMEQEDYHIWLYRVGKILAPLHNPKLSHERFIVQLTKTIMWNGIPEGFFAFFQHATKWSIEIVMKICDIHKLVKGYIYFGNYVLNDSISHTIYRQIALYELAYYSINHRDQLFTNAIYRKIIDRIDHYSETKLGNDVIALLLSFEFTLLYHEHQPAMNARLKQMVDLRLNKDYSHKSLQILYQPNSKNEHKWKSFLTNGWKININHNRFGVAVDTNRKEKNNFTCKVLELNEDFEYEIKIIMQLEQSRSGVQLSPTFHEMFEACNQRFFLFERFDYTLDEYTHILDVSKFINYRKKQALKLNLNKQLFEKATALINLGLYYNKLQPSGVVIKGGLPNKECELFFIDFFNICQIDTPDCEDAVTQLANQMIKKVKDTIETIRII